MVGSGLFVGMGKPAHHAVFGSVKPALAHLTAVLHIGSGLFA